MDSGIYYRVERNGKWKTVDMTQMTDEELNKWLCDMTEQQLFRTIRVLVRQIGEIEVVDE